uniref:Uncharacterized protein n=1 Tax=Panagrolaimus sp. JU765 TaxID=591449 RepID=A0AC34QSM4_9BILA
MDLMDLNLMPTISSTVVKNNLTNYVNEARELVDRITNEIIKQQKAMNDDDSDSEDENEPSVSYNLSEPLEKLKKLTEQLEDSTFLITTCFEMSNTRITELEEALRLRDEQIQSQKQHITILSSNCQSQWTTTNPDILSLRRSHTTRLDYLCKLKRDLNIEKSKNLSLLKKEKQLKDDYSTTTLTLSIEIENLQKDYQNQKKKCELQEKEIENLKRQLTNEKKKNKFNGHQKIIQKQNLKLLQKQLRNLNLTSNTLSKLTTKSNNVLSTPTSTPTENAEFENWIKLIAASELPKNATVNDIYTSICKFAEERVNIIPPKVSDQLPTF